MTEFEERLRAKAAQEAAEVAPVEAKPEGGNGEGREDTINLVDSKEMAKRILGAAEAVKGVGLKYEAGQATSHEAVEMVLRAQFVILLALGSNFVRMAEMESRAVLAQTMRGFRMPPMRKE